MALDFPANPTDGEIYGSYTYLSSKGVWQSREESAAVAVTSPTPPESASNGDIWIDTSDGVAYFYYSDGTSSQWVELMSSGVTSLALKADKTYVDSQDLLKANLSGAAFTGGISSTYTGGVPHFDAINTSSASDQYNVILRGANDGGYKAVHFINSSTRTADGGSNTYTIRNDGGKLNLGNTPYETTIFGRTLMPNQTAFYARGAETSGTLTNGADIPFSNAEVNIGGNYNTSSYRFTAPVAGVYQINTSLFNVGGSGRVSIKVNGASKYNSQNNWDVQWAWAGAIYLNANDYVTVGDWQGLSGAAIYYGHSSFSGFLVG